MKTKKLFKEKTIYIKNGDMLEEVKDLIQKPLWGYDETFKYDKVVSSGYLHYGSSMFYLSKENFNKEEMNLDQLILEL